MVSIPQTNKVGPGFSSLNLCASFVPLRDESDTYIAGRGASVTLNQIE